MRKIERGELLRLGLAGALLAAAPARAAGPAPTPQGDDIGFVQWGATAELVAVTFWNRAIEADRFGERIRRHLSAMREADRHHYGALSTALGEEAPTTEDFEVVLPKRAFASKAGIIELAEDIEESITRTYLAAVSEAVDPATRLLIGKLLVQDVSHLDAVRSLAGAPSAFAGQRGPLELEQAGRWLDRHLRVRS
jgi:rubrerythrin